jgi:hypothetical protein
MNDALAAFSNALEGYLPLLQIWGTRILGAATFIGFGYALIQATTHRDWFATLMAFGWGVVRIAMVYVFMDNVILWGNAFPDLGQIVGTDISGQSPLVMTPSGFYDFGLQIIYLMDDARTVAAWFEHPIETIFFMVITVLTDFTWIAASIIYLWLLIETKFYVAIGPITICFASFEHTWIVLEHWLVSLLQVGIRLLTALLILAIDISLAHAWTATLSAAGYSINRDAISFGMVQLLDAVIVFYALWTLPSKAASIIRSQGSHGVGAESSGGDRSIWNLITRR